MHALDANAAASVTRLSLCPHPQRCIVGAEAHLADVVSMGGALHLVGRVPGCDRGPDALLVLAWQSSAQEGATDMAETSAHQAVVRCLALADPTGDGCAAQATSELGAAVPLFWSHPNALHAGVRVAGRSLSAAMGASPALEPVVGSLRFLGLVRDHLLVVVDSPVAGRQFGVLHLSTGLVVPV